MHFRDIPQFPKAHYETHVSWRYLEEQLTHRANELPLILEPDYQRGHVWTPEQQTAFVEYALMGGETSMNITTNCPGWMSDYSGPYELVDGLQRITAAMGFLKGTVKAFGKLYSEFEGKMSYSTGPSFNWRVMTLPTRKEVLKLYLLINSGGVVHSSEEIARVKKLLETE